jgi:hypothetical protein
MSAPDRLLVRPRGVEWLYLAGGLFFVLRYLWFLDDAFIYYRYVDNFLFLKIGLVYNAGEYADGISGPLWLLVLLPLRALELGWGTIVRSAALVGFALFAWMLIGLNRRLAGPSPRINFPLAYLGFNYGVLCYFSSGLGTPLIQIAAVAYALYVLRPGSRWLAVLVGITPLIRYELWLPLILAAAWSWLRCRRPPWLLLAVAAVAGASWTLFHVWYYADFFPVTFYLKDELAFAQGWTYLHDTLGTYWFYLFALAFLLLIVVLQRAGEQIWLAERGVMLLIATALTLYVVKVGGDARHYRYLAFPFCLAICSTAGLLERAWLHFFQERLLRLAPALGLLVAALSLSFYPAQLRAHPLNGNVRHRTLKGIADANIHRHNPDLQPESWEGRTSPNQMRAFRERTRRFHYRGIASSGWCVESYCHFDLRIVQHFGLTEPFLARTDSPTTRPSHKHGLIPLAKDLVEMRRGRRNLDRGMFRRLVERGRAPEWIARNLETIEVIERKVYNRHELRENLRLALTFPDPIVP